MKPFKIGHYQATAVIGRGGMATVYRAFDSRFDREVAIKVLPREFLHDPSFRARFQREAKIIGSLEHGAIVPVHDFGEDDGQPYLVMRLMTGGSLEQKILAGPLSLAEAARIISGIAPALDEAHAKGVVHRDLKPANILFDQHDEPFLADFGIARQTHSVTLTGPAVTVGTPAYMSPEQGRGDPGVDGQSDIYSLGAILFEMLSGRVPYEGETPTGQIIRHITDPVPNILELCRDLPSDCQVVIDRAMAKKKEDRFTTVAEMAQTLTAISQGHPLPRKLKKKAQPTPHIVPVRKTLLAEPAKLPPISKRFPIGLWAGIGGVLLLALLAGFRWIVYPAAFPKSRSTPTATLGSTKPITLPTAIFTATPQPSATREIVAAPLTLTFTPTTLPSPTLTRSATATPAPKATDTPTLVPMAVVNIANARLRTGPGDVYGIIDTLGEGMELQVEGCNVDRDWLKVFWADKNLDGWIALKTVDIDMAVVSTLPVLDTPPTPTPTPKPQIIPTSTRSQPKPKKTTIAPTPRDTTGPTKAP